MKKILCLVLAAVLLLVANGAAAELPEFDKSIVEGSSLYSYDKFTDAWMIMGKYTKIYSNEMIAVALVSTSEHVEGGLGPEMRIVYLDAKNQAILAVNAFRAVIGEKCFSFENLTVGDRYCSMVGGKVMQEFCDALLMGEPVSFQIEFVDYYGRTWSGTLDDPVPPDDLEELREMVRLFNESDIWLYSVAPDVWDEMFNATVK